VNVLGDLMDEQLGKITASELNLQTFVLSGNREYFVIRNE